MSHPGGPTPVLAASGTAGRTDPSTVLGTDRRVWRRGRFSVVVDPRAAVVSVVLLLAVLGLGAYALTIGSVHLDPVEVLRATVGISHDHRAHSVIWNLRLPRVVTAVFVGAALGASGAVFQSVSRNALGSPDVIGFTTGAATGALVQIVVFSAPGAQIALGAVLGGLATAVLVHLLSRRAGVSGGHRLVLVGIGVGALLSAVNGLLLVTGDLDSAVTANLWLSGSLDARRWTHALPVVLGVLICLPLLGLLARRATVLEMGDDLAMQLGIRVERTRTALLLIAVLLAGLATGAAGPIAFVALAAPQLVIRLTRQPTMPVVGAASMGSLLLVLPDVVSQSVPLLATLPIGRMTGIIGGLYLIWLLTRSEQL